MSAKYFAILTNLGAAKIANATALGTKLNVTHMAVGDGGGSLQTPDPGQTALRGERRRAALNMLSVDPNNASQIIAEQVIPENEGGWWIREIGLYDSNGVLIAVANCPETYKPQLQEGSGRTQTIRMVLIVSSTEAVTLKIDPSVVLATREYVDSKLGEHARSRNHPDATTAAKGFVQLSSATNSDREDLAGTPKAIKIAMDNANERLAKARNLSDLPNPALARQNLQLGDSATKNTGTAPGTVAEGNDARLVGAMQKNQNGKDIPDVDLFLENLGLGAGSALPVGVPIPWPSDTPPVGWLKCNGASFIASKYPKLAIAYPSLKLPDLRGEFIRGWDDGRGVDKGRDILSFQEQSVQHHAHNTEIKTAGGPTRPSGNAYNVTLHAGEPGSLDDKIWMETTSMINSIANETRPRNRAFNFIVRAA
ncbi:hypothetical protein ETAR_30010 [Edwardsiella tarda]